MTAHQIEALKALALAASELPDTTQPFVSSTGWVVVGTFSLKGEQLNTVAKFYDAANPATILELIAENQRLTAERDTLDRDCALGAKRINEAADELQRLRAELAAGAATSASLKGISKYEWYLMDRDDTEYYKVADIERLLGATPAAEAEKDAQRYRWLRDEENADDAWDMIGSGLDSGKLDAAVDAAIAAHAKEPS